MAFADEHPELAAQIEAATNPKPMRLSQNDLMIIKEVIEDHWAEYGTQGDQKSLYDRVIAAIKA